MRTILKAAVAGSVLLAGSLTLTVPAFAAGGTPTTVTVTGKTPVYTGRPVTFRALVQPSVSGSSKISGTVTWTVQGLGSSVVVPCANASTLSKAGKSSCKIAAAQLVGHLSPYTVTASYSGDANFAPSSGTLSQPVTTANAHVKITLDAPVTSGSATTVNVVVSGGAAAQVLVSGDASFVVDGFSNPNGTPPTATCTGGKFAWIQPLVSAMASCNLPAGWIIVPAPTKSAPKPKAVYHITVQFVPSYLQDFNPAIKAVQGTIH